MLQSCPTLCDSMGFSRQEYWSGLPFPSPGDLPDLGIEPTSLMFPVLARRFLTTSANWEAPFIAIKNKNEVSLLLTKKSQATLVRYFVLSPYNEQYLTKVAWFCMRVWTFFGIAFLWDWNENWSFAVLWLLLSFPKSRTWLSDWMTTITKEVLCQSMCKCVLTHSVVSNSATPWTVAHQAPLSMESSRQEYWSGLPFLSPGDLPNPGIEPKSLAGGFLPLSHLGSLCQSIHNPVHKSSEGKRWLWMQLDCLQHDSQKCLSIPRERTPAVAPVNSHLGPQDPDLCGQCCKVDYDTVRSEVPTHDDTHLKSHRRWQYLKP